MFSFLKFFNNSTPANGGRTSSDRNGAEAAKTLNGGLPVARRPSRTNSFESSCRDTIISPGFSFRLAQKAREVRSSTSSADTSNLSNSYTLETSLNNTSTINGNNKSRDVNDKKRKLMESLDNFGVRKRTRQESGVDAIFYPRRRTISKSYSDRLAPKNTYCYKLAQPISTGLNSIAINSENKKTERQDDFETSMNHTQKKPRTRNNEILSSYSSSKFLLKSGQKRSYQPIIDYEEEEPPARKHCKSCTCCGSTLVLDSDQNNLNKSDKTTETDLSDDLVTVAASRIFNRSGKTQVIKRMPMKTIHDELLDDIDLTPYTSIEKVEAKKKKAQKKDTMVTSNAKDSNNSPATKFQHGVHPVESGVLSARPTIESMSSTAAATPTLASAAAMDTPKTSSGGSTASPSTQTNQSPESGVNVAQTADGQNGVGTEDKAPRTGGPDGSSKKDDDKPLLQFTAAPPPAAKSTDPSNKPSAAKSPAFRFGGQDTVKDAAALTFGDSSKSPPPSTFTFGAASKSSTAFAQFGAPKADDTKSAAPVLQFGSPKADGTKPAAPVLQFGSPKADGTKSAAPVLQFGSPKVDDAKSAAPVLQFGSPKADDAKSAAPVLQFGAPKVDKTKSVAPVLQFGAHTSGDTKSAVPVLQFGGAPKANDTKSAVPVLQFGGAPKANDTKSAAPVLQFGAAKASESSSIPSFSFGSKPDGIAKSATEPLKFQFGPVKPSDAASPQTVDATKSAGSSQNQNVFGGFGKTDPPKYGAVDKPAPTFQFGTSPAFGGSAADQPKPADQPKLVFGGQDKPATAATTSSNSGMLFANTAPVFQFNSAAAKPDDKPNASSTSTFAFPAAKPAPPTFSASSPFQFGAPKTAAAESKTQFSSGPAFGSQTASAAPFKFGGGTVDKTAAPFGSTVFPATSSQQQPLRLTTNSSAEKPAEPFKFGAAAPSSGTFQFGGDGKAGNGAAATTKFGQPTNAFSAAPNAFGGFSGLQPTSSAFGSVPAPQPSPFGNAVAAPPAFGGPASPPSNAFGTTQGFQFGGTSSTTAFNFGGGSNAAQPTKPSGPFNFNAAPANAVSPFQFGSTAPQFGAPQSQAAISFGSPPMNTNGMPGSSQPLFSMGTAPAGERRKAKAVRRRQ